MNRAPGAWEPWLTTEAQAVYLAAPDRAPPDLDARPRLTGDLRTIQRLPGLLVQLEEVRVHEISPRDPAQGELTRLYHEVDGELRVGDFWRVEDRLLRVDPDAPTAHLVGLLRITWPARAHLVHWSTARARIRAALLARGEDADILLRGLHNDTTCITVD